MTEADAGVWQDREIRFDVPFALLKPRRGEVEIDSINSVEDTKGNNGEKGQLAVTNLRLIWCSHKDPRTNLSQMTREQRATSYVLSRGGGERMRGAQRAGFPLFLFLFLACDWMLDATGPAPRSYRIRSCRLSEPAALRTHLISLSPPSPPLVPALRAPHLPPLQASA